MVMYAAGTSRKRHVPGDGLAHGGEPLSESPCFTGESSGSAATGSAADRGRGSLGHGRCAAVGGARRGSLDIRARDAAPEPSPGDGREVDAVFTGETPDGRGHADISGELHRGGGTCRLRRRLCRGRLLCGGRGRLLCGWPGPPPVQWPGPPSGRRGPDERPARLLRGRGRRSQPPAQVRQPSRLRPVDVPQRPLDVRDGGVVATVSPSLTRIWSACPRTAKEPRRSPCR